MTVISSEVATADAELTYCRCRWCGSAMERTRLFCSVCGATEMDERVSTGLGTIRRIMRSYRPEHTGDQVRQICAVHLDEGFTVVATVRHGLLQHAAEGTRVHLRSMLPGRPAFEFTPC